MTIQLVIINATYGPSCLLIVGKKAFRYWSTKMTIAEVTIMYVIILYWGGINFLKSDTIKQEMARTNTTDNPIASAFSILLLTARAEQSPNN